MKLFNRIILFSEADNWNEAKKEWAVDSVYYDEEGDECICGHRPIKEICYLVNSNNQNLALVGNCCVNKFFDIETSKIFSCIKRLKKK